MVKLIENTYRDVNIALANELALISETLGIDAIEAIEAATHHPRVDIHTPGPGVGGHYLAVDPYFILETAREKGMNPRLIMKARQINESMPQHMAELIKDALREMGKSIQDSEIGVLGVAYKGNVADARETPAEPLIKILNLRGADVYAHDPHVPRDGIEALGAKPMPLEEVLRCDAVVLITDHDEYREITPR